MANKKILLVGDGNHQFIVNLAIWLKIQKKEEFQIDILSFTRVEIKNEIHYNNIYRIKDQNLIFRGLEKIKGVRRYYRFFLYELLLKKLSQFNYDIINFHYLSVDSCFLVKKFKQSTSSILVLSIWGSDLYRVSSKNESRLLKACKLAHRISFTNEKAMEFFLKKYSWNQKNLSICRFGLAPLDNLEKLLLDKFECKKYLGWNLEMISIVIGYNLNSGQQHLEILECFENEILTKYKDMIQLILPLTYGGSKDYKNQIVTKLQKLPFSYKIYDTFLSDDSVAYLRKATDIMIQLQKTDQLSGSMMEHLYARNIVITGAWLPYEVMKKEGAWFLEIETIDELSRLLPDIIRNNNNNNYQCKTINNPRAVANLGLWRDNINSWIALYS